MSNRTEVHEVPEGTRVVVSHLHDGNTTLEQRQGHKYVTFARLMRGRDTVLSTGKSTCSKRDVPDRALGREIAVGRCLVNYYKGENAS